MLRYISRLLLPVLCSVPWILLPLMPILAALCWTLGLE